MTKSTVVIVGGAGALGRAFITHFSASSTTVNIDYVANNEASHNIILDEHKTLNQVNDELTKVLQANNASNQPQKVKLIANVAGGWAGGSVADSELMEKARKMWKMNTESSLLAANLATNHLESSGMLLFVGAKAVESHPTPDMLAYALSKSALTHLLQTLSSCPQESGLPTDARVIGLYPEVLDTEANRKAMPKADFGKWTPCLVIAEKVGEWLNEEGGRTIVNGAKCFIVTRAGQTEFIMQ